MEQYQDLLPQTGEELSFEKALETVRELDQELKTLLAQKEELEKMRGDLQDSRDQVWPFAGLDYDINRHVWFPAYRNSDFGALCQGIL